MQSTRNGVLGVARKKSGNPPSKRDTDTRLAVRHDTGQPLEGTAIESGRDR
jgi:hypothetical protein